MQIVCPGESVKWMSVALKKYGITAEILTNIYKANSEFIFVTGHTNLEILQSVKLFPKNMKLGSLHGKIKEYESKTIMVSFAYSDYPDNLKYQAWLICDLLMFNRLETTGRLWQDFDKQWISSLDDISVPQSGWLAVDTETQGLDPFSSNGRIVAFSFSFGHGKAYGYYFDNSSPLPSDTQRKEIEFLLNHADYQITGANLKYDLLWIKEAWGITCSNFAFDTTIVGSMLNESLSNSLNTHSKLYTPYGGYDDSFNENFDKSRMSDVSADDMIAYSLGDALATFEVSEIFRKKLAAEEALIKSLLGRSGPETLYKNLMHPISNSFTKIESRGVHVDLTYWDTLLDSMKIELEHIHETAIDMLPNSIKEKYEDDLTLTRSAIIKSFLFSEQGLNLTPKVLTGKTGEPSTSITDHLVKFKDHKKAGPFVNALLNFSKKKKTYSTYIQGFKEYVREDGKLHPTAILYRGDWNGEGDEGGTVTARLSFKDPAIQVIPSHTKDAAVIRRIFTAPKGYGIIAADFGQLELRLAAHYSNDKTMVKAYNEGQDLHKLTARQILSLTEQEFNTLPKSEIAVARQKAKPCFSGDTELLTPRGWVPIADLLETDKVMQWGGVRGVSSFVQPSAYYHHKNATIRHYESHNFSLPITYDHRQPLWVKKDKWRFNDRKISDYSLDELSESAIPVSGRVNGFDKGHTAKVIAGLFYNGQYDIPTSIVEDFKLYAENENSPIQTIELDSKLTRVQHNGVISETGVELVDIRNILPLLEIHGLAHRIKRAYYVKYNRHLSFDFLNTIGALNGYSVKILKGSACEYLVFTKTKAAIFSRGMKLSVRKNQDVYCVDVPSTFVYIRHNGKICVSGNCNFGLIYCQQPKGLRAYAERGYGVIMSLQEAEEYYEAWHDTYKGILPWHKETIEFARKHKFVVSAIGRVRHLPFINSSNWGARMKAERQAVNSIVQSFGSDLNLMAINQLEEDFSDEIQVFATVHDSIYAYCKEETLEENARLVKSVMENLNLTKYDCNIKIPIVADVKIGPNLWDLTEIKGLE